MKVCWEGRKQHSSLLLLSPCISISFFFQEKKWRKGRILLFLLHTKQSKARAPFGCMDNFPFFHKNTFLHVNKQGEESWQKSRQTYGRFFHRQSTSGGWKLRDRTKQNNPSFFLKKYDMTPAADARWGRVVRQTIVSLPFWLKPSWFVMGWFFTRELSSVAVPALVLKLLFNLKCSINQLRSSL